MVPNVLVVVLEGRGIGEIDRLARGTLRLRYDDTYSNDPIATPLSVSMFPTGEAYNNARITPWLWGLLPDNADVLGRWGRQFSVSVTSPFPLLGTQVGRDCAGAVQFCPPHELDELIGRRSDIRWLTEGDVAARLRMLRADSTSWLGPGFTGQFSLGGAQAKTALHRADGRWGVPTGAVPTTHILKPAVPGFAEQHLNEHLCLTAARLAGLPTANTTIQRFEDETAIVVERFDRTTRDGALVRVHQEDVCQALSVPPGGKYQSEGGPSPGAIAELIRSTMPGSDAQTDVWRFVDALAFNWIIAGTDAHAKNYGLLLSANQIRLAPLYDIASFLPYDDSHGHKVTLAMKVGDDYRLRSTDRKRAWEHAADELKLNRTKVLQRVRDLANRIPGAFGQAAEQAEVIGLQTDLPHRLAELVAGRSEHCRSVLS